MRIIFLQKITIHLVLKLEYSILNIRTLERLKVTYLGPIIVTVLSKEIKTQTLLS